MRVGSVSSPRNNGMPPRTHPVSRATPDGSATVKVTRSRFAAGRGAMYSPEATARASGCHVTTEGHAASPARAGRDAGDARDEDLSLLEAETG